MNKIEKLRRYLKDEKVIEILARGKQAIEKTIRIFENP